MTLPEYPVPAGQQPERRGHQLQLAAGDAFQGERKWTLKKHMIGNHDDPKAQEAAMAGGCVGYFRKTDSGSEILEAIRRVVSSPAPGP